MKELKRYFSYMGKHIYLYWTILITTLIVESVLTILYSYINKKILNSVEYQDMQMFRAALMLCVIVVALKCLFPYLRYFEIRLVRKMVFEIKIKMFHKLLRLDMEYYEKNHSGETLKTLNFDANSLKDSYFSHVYWVLGKITGGAAALISMIVYSRELTVVSLVISSITITVSINVNRRIKAKEKEIQKGVANLTKRLSDILFGFPILKMYAGSFIVADNYRAENERVTDEENKRVRQAAALEMITFLLGILGSFGTIIAGAFLAADGRVDYGTVMAVVSLQMSVSTMMQRLGSALATFSSSLVKAGRVFDFMELGCEEVSAGKAIKVNSKEQPIKISGLTFAYDGTSRVFEGMNLNVSNNEKVMLVGESGGGKSTLLKLMLRFYKEASGQIQLYGNDIDKYPLAQLREMITYIPQNSYLFEGTVGENIAYGCITKSRQEIINAAKMAYADEFISEMPQGYDTMISMGGSNLSGGQRQRIAIARAFLKNSQILLMDEPSSALDIESEKKIHEAIKKLMETKIVLMVTHRRTGINDFDRVVEIKNHLSRQQSE